MPQVCIRGGPIYCIKWSEIHSKNKSHLILICQGFVARSVGVLYSLFTTLILMACWSYRKKRLWVNTCDLKLSSHLPAAGRKTLTAMFYVLQSHLDRTLWCDVKPVETEKKLKLIDIHTCTHRLSGVLFAAHMLVMSVKMIQLLIAVEVRKRWVGIETSSQS